MYFSEPMNIMNIYNVELKLLAAGIADTARPPPRQPPCFVLS